MEPPAHIIQALEAATRDPASSLHFTPVKLRARADGWTPERQRLFIAALAAFGHAGRAAAWVGMTEQTAARLRRREGAHSFARAYAAAFGFAKRMKHEAARRKGAEGSQGPEGFSPRGSSPTTKFEPSARPAGMARHASRPGEA